MTDHGPTGWRAADTLPALGQKVAEWLLGRVQPDPGWGSPAPETRMLIPTLVDLNRAGFVTVTSQPGRITPRIGRPSGSVVQRAAVEGFADTAMLARLAAVVAAGSFDMIAQTTVRWPGFTDPFDANLNEGVLVTKSGGVPMTWFGRQLTASYLATDPFFEGLSTECLANAWNVTIFDPCWGSNGLWPALRSAAHSATVKDGVR